MSLLKHGLAFVNAAEQDASRTGAALVVRSAKLDRSALLGQLARLFVEDGHDLAEGELSPRVLICSHDSIHLRQIRPRIDQHLRGIRARYVDQSTSPDNIAPVSYATTGAVNIMQRTLRTGEFDFAIVDVRRPGELTAAAERLGWLDLLFTVLVLSPSCQDELRHWPQCGPSLLLQGELGPAPRI